MSDTALRTRTVTEIVDAAFKLYSRNMAQYVFVTAIAYSPALVASLILRPGDLSTTNPDPMKAVSGFLVTMLISIVGIAIMNAVITALGSRAYLGEDVDVQAALRQSLPRVPSLLLAAFVSGICYIAGWLLFLVGFFWVAALLFAVVPIIVLERRGVIGSIARSARLSKGHKLHILGTLLMAYAIYLLGSIAISIVFAFTGSFVLITLASTLYTIVAFPVVGLTTMVLYYDMRIRLEGFDLERMTQQLGESGLHSEPVIS